MSHQVPVRVGICPSDTQKLLLWKGLEQEPWPAELFSKGPSLQSNRGTRETERKGRKNPVQAVTDRFLPRGGVLPVMGEK